MCCGRGRLEMEVRQGIDESFSTCLKSESERCSAAAAESRQSCPTLCDPIDSVVSNSVTPWGYTVYGILQDRIAEWVAFPFSRGSSQPRDPTQVSCIAGRFFTSWGTREAQEYWSGQPILSPGDLPDPGIKLGSPALQVDSLPTELWGKPKSQN